MSKLKISGTADDSIVDGPGLRFTIFTQGCPHNCPDCHNPQTHIFDGGNIVDTDELFMQITDNILLDGVTFSGGEPMSQPKPLLELAKRIKAETDLNIIIYSGYTYEALLAMNDADITGLLNVADLLIDGEYIKAKRDLSLLYRGSSNQRIIALPNCSARCASIPDVVDYNLLGGTY